MKISELNRYQSNELYKQVLKDNDKKTLRELCLNDLFFLLYIACSRRDINRDWIYDRCREVENDSDGNLDLWFRAGYKSSIITFGLTIRDILIDSNITVGIFSHTRPIAKAFLAQIKREFEVNTFLQGLFPDILYKEPKRESTKWSLDSGIVVRRKSNPKESTVEAWGLVDGMPTSKHYKLLVYDDVVSRDSVTTPEMINKTTEAFRLSLNLASENCRKRFIGTRYHSQDTYQKIIESGTANPRIYPATDDGTLKGKSVLLTDEELEEKYRDMGVYVFSCQMLQNPLADKAMGFKESWLQYYDVLRKTKGWNYYIIVDPASEKRKENDYTSMWVIGTAPDGNYYIVDGLRDRLNLTERSLNLFRLHRIWKPLNVGYEKYGMQSDIEHLRYVMSQEGYRFRVTELKGSMAKNDRIRRLVPLFENARVWMPRTLNKVTHEGKVYNLTESFVDEEYMTFPVGKHDDMLDCLSRVCDVELNVQFPKVGESLPLAMAISDDRGYNPLEIKKGSSAISMRDVKPVNRIITWREAMTKN